MTVKDTQERLGSYPRESITTMLNTMASIEASVSRGGKRKFSLSGAALTQYLHATGNLRCVAEDSKVWIPLCREHIMIAETVITDFLFKECTTRCAEVLETESWDACSETDWLPRLCRNTAAALESRQERVLTSSEYISTTDVPERTWTVKRRPMADVLQGQLSVTAGAEVSRILRDWFNLTVTFQSQARAALVNMFITCLGSGSLLLDSTWEVYETLPSWLFDSDARIGRDGQSHTAVKFNPGLMSTFKEALQNSKPADRASEVFRQMSALQQAYEALGEAARTRVGSARKGGSQLASLPIRRSAAQLLREGPAPVGPSTDVSAQAVRRFLREAYDVRSGPGDTPQRRTKLQKRMLANLDFFQPLREWGPSRQRINGRVGTGIDADFARTRAGFFSLMVFRLISFNTRPLLETPISSLTVCFADLAQFDAYLTEMRHRYPGIEDTELCNAKAYTRRPLRDRSLQAKDHFWKTAKECSWNTDRMLSFSDGWEWLTKMKSGSSMPGAGKLSLYLLLADMACAGLVAMPTVQEMGSMIHKLQSGALAGLRVAGYLPADSGTVLTDVQTAFEAFYNDIEQLREEADLWEWDTLTAEHTLCKIKRLTKLIF